MQDPASREVALRPLPMPAAARWSSLRLLLIAVLLAGAGSTSPTAATTPAADRMQIPGGTRAVARLVGYVDPRDEYFAASLNRVLLRRIRSDHDWQRVQDRLLLSEYVATVRELRRAFPGRTVLALDGERLPQDYMDLAAFFGFQYRGGEWIVPAGTGDADDRALKRSVAFALDLNIRSLAYRLQRGESVVVEIPMVTVDAPMPFSEWSALAGVEITPENALTHLIQDQRFGLLLEGLRRADRDLPGVLGREGTQTTYRNGSLPFYRYSPAIQLQKGELVLPGGPASAAIWRKLVGARPDDPRAFLLAMLDEEDTRAAHFWHAMHFADPETSRFLLTGGRRASALRGPLLDYIDRIFQAQGAGLLGAGRGGDYSVSTLARSLPLDDGGEAERIAARSAPWLERRTLQQACVDETRFRKIVRKIKNRGVPQDHFLEQLLGEATPLHGALGLLFQPFVEIQALFEDHPETLTPANVLLLRRAAAYRPLLLQTLLHLPFDQPDDLTDYLLTAEHLDCLEPAPERDALLLTFQGGVELLSMLMRERRLPRDAVSRGLSSWSEIHRNASNESVLNPRHLQWLRETVNGLAEPGADAPGRGPAEQRLLAAFAGGPGKQSFGAYGLRYSGRRGHDLAASMRAFLSSQSIAAADLLFAVEDRLNELRDALRHRDDMRMRLQVFQILALLEPLEVPPEARIAGLEDPMFADSVRHRLEVRQLIETWRGQPRIGEGTIARTLVLVQRLLAREFEGLLCSLPYLQPIAMLGDTRFDQPLLVLRHAVARAVDPQSAALEIFPSAWNETAVVPAAFSPAGSHVAGSLTQVPRALVQHHVLSLAPERPAHTWINVRPWLSAALESGWRDLPSATFRLVGAALDAGDALIDAATSGRETLSPGLSDALDRLIPRRRFQDAVADGLRHPLSAPSERLLAGILLLEQEATPASLAGPRRALVKAAEGSAPDWRAALQPLGIPTPRLNGKARPWVGPWPAYEALEREASIAALRERQLLDVSIAVLHHAQRRGLPPQVAYDVLLRVLEHIPEEVMLEFERDWESLVRFTASIDGPHLDGRLRECLIRGLYSVEPF